MKKSELQQIIKEEIAKVLNEVGMFHDPRMGGGTFSDDDDKWENGAFHVKYRMLLHRNITNATEMAKKYENKSWETVKRELKIK
jgi:hypothetical protein